MLSLIIPTFNEAAIIKDTIVHFNDVLNNHKITHEFIIVNGRSTDNTEEILLSLQKKIPEIKIFKESPPYGFGLAVRTGLENFKGEAVALVMADGSDSPEDVIRFYNKLKEGYDCVFGTRFRKNGNIINYPIFKLSLNRLFNYFICILFQIKYNDVTNAFKMYSAQVIPGLQPLLSQHFNITVELPLKAIIRGYSYAVLDNKWEALSPKISKLNISKMGKRYLFITFYCLLEKWLSMKDFNIKSKKVLT